MSNISARLAHLQAEAERRDVGLMTVCFDDGHIERMNSGDAIDLALSDDAHVLHFEGGSGHGALPDLLNGLLEN